MKAVFLLHTNCSCSYKIDQFISTSDIENQRFQLINRILSSRGIQADSIAFLPMTIHELTLSVLYAFGEWCYSWINANYIDVYKERIAEIKDAKYMIVLTHEFESASGITHTQKMSKGLNGKTLNLNNRVFTAFSGCLSTEREKSQNTGISEARTESFRSFKREGCTSIKMDDQGQEIDFTFDEDAISIKSSHYCLSPDFFSVEESQRRMSVEIPDSSLNTSKFTNRLESLVSDALLGKEELYSLLKENAFNRDELCEMGFVLLESRDFNEEMVLKILKALIDANLDLCCHNLYDENLAEVAFANHYRKTALYIVSRAKEDFRSLVKRLITKYPSILFHCFENDDEKVARILIENGADLNALYERINPLGGVECRPLIFGALSSKAYKVIQLMLERKTLDFSIKDPYSGLTFISYLLSLAGRLKAENSTLLKVFFEHPDIRATCNKFQLKELDKWLASLFK